MRLDLLTVPTKGIWDPTEEEEEEDKDDSTVDDDGSATKSRHRRKHGKHPSQMDEFELRMNLWDSFRLARIILGIPIKSFSLKNKTILKAIRVVAEMKLEVIRLTKELEIKKIKDETTEGLHSGTIVDKAADELNDMYQAELEEQKSKYKAMQKEHDEVVESMQSQLQELAMKLQKESLHQQERQDVLDLVKSLELKMEEASNHTNQKLEVLEGKIRETQTASLTRQHSQEMIKLEKKMQTSQTLHVLEIESSKAKHLQQVVDLSGQLDTYKEQVENQQADLLDAKAKYQKLEAIAVLPHEARDVLKALNALNDESSEEEAVRVKTQMVEILKRMAIVDSRNRKEEKQMEESLRVARKKEEDSKEELLHMRLQEEILDEETKIPPEDWREQMSAERAAYKFEMSEIMSREEARFIEMEQLEVHLTQLAFLAVAIEDLQKEAKENQKRHNMRIIKKRTKQETTRKRVEGLQSEVQEIIDQQRLTLSELSKSSGKRSNVATKVSSESTTQLDNISRLRRLEAELAKRDEELLKTKKELRLSQQRVLQLEGETS